MTNTSTAGETARDSARSLAGGRLCIVAASILWSTSGLYAKHPTFLDWPIESRGMLLAFWRALFAGLLILPLARRPRWRVELLPMVLCFALMNATYLSSMTLTTAANAIWLQNTAPVWVFLAGILLLHERPTRGDLVLLLFGMLGVGTILCFELRDYLQARSGTQMLGVSLGVLAGVFYGGVVLFMRLLRSENAAWLVSLNLLATAAALAPYVFYLDIWPTPGQLVLLACFGLFQMGLPYVLFAHGLRHVSSQEAAGITLLEPVLVPVWLLAATSPEYPAPWTIAGGALILLGLVVRYGRRAKSHGERG